MNITDRIFTRELEYLLHRAAFKDCKIYVGYDHATDSTMVRVKGPACDRTMKFPSVKLLLSLNDFSDEVLAPFVAELGAA